MNILAIDTSTSSMSICIMSDKTVKGEINLNNGLVHSTTLMPCMESLFNMIDFDKKAIDLIAVCIGPGSFTGIRIGVATANAMSMALDIPVVSVDSLEALAMNYIQFEGVVISTIDAQRDNFYVGIYKADKNRMISLSNNSIMSDCELNNYIKCSKDKILILGDALESIDIDKCKVAEHANNYIKSSNVAVLGERIYKDKKSDNFANPVYMRKSQAEIVYEEKIRNEKSEI